LKIYFEEEFIEVGRCNYEEKINEIDGVLDMTKQLHKN
jgi:hypothetical protein